MKPKRKKRDFYELNAISIEKFLGENSNLLWGKKLNNRNRKWRIKHSEILGIDNFILVPLSFAYRYKELVKTGKIVIVRDDFGFLKAYINPQIIAKSCVLEEFEMLLNDFLEDNLRGYSVDENSQKTLIYQIEDLQENIRLIKLFHGEEAFEESKELYATSEEERKLELKRVATKRSL